MVHVNVGPERYGPDTPRNLQQFYADNGMTDFLPIFLPTDEMVEEMLAGTSHKPDEVVGKMAAGAYPPWEYHGEAGGHQRGDGGMQARIFSNDVWPLRRRGRRRY